MRKLSIALSMVMLVALLLSACSTSNNNNQTPGVVQTPGVGITPGGLATPVAGTTVVETPIVTQAVTAVPESTGTVEAKVPVTGNDKACYPNRLSNILNYKVVDANNKEIGEVDGVVLNRDAAGEMLSGTGEVNTTTTPAATQDANKAGDQVLDASKMAAPSIAYLVVNLENDGKLGDKDVLMPFKAFRLPSAVANPAKAAVTPETTVVATVAAGAADAVNAVVGCNLALTIQPDALQSAPTIDHGILGKGDIDLNQPTWDDQFRTYWSGHGISIPQADPANGMKYGNPVVFTEDFKGIDVENVKGDNLGDIREFIVDPQTGQIQYAVLGAGGFLGLGEKFIPVPANQIAWVDKENNFEDPGKMVINVPEDTFKKAPSFDDLDAFSPTNDWNGNVNTFWQGVRPTSQ